MVADDRQRKNELGEEGLLQEEVHRVNDADFARAVKKIGQLSDAQFAWAILRMRHLGFSPCGGRYQNPTQQSN